VTDSRNTKDLTQRLIRIAHKLIENSQSGDGEEIIEISHEIRGRSIYGSLPDNSLMQSLALLMADMNCNYAIIGGVALAVHGQVRNTEDIDALVDPFPEKSKTKNSEYMKTFGFYPASSSTGTVLTLDHRRDGQVELLAVNSPLRQWAISTASKTMVLGTQVPVISAAALVALKISAMVSSPKRRVKDHPDIISVLIKSNPNMDEALRYLSDPEKVELAKIMNSLEQ